MLCLSATATLGAGDAAPPVDVKVTLGQSIERTWDEIRADGYAYGPKQVIDEKTGETRVFLPYGNNPRLYAELRGMKLGDTTHDWVATATSDPAASESVLTYKIVFDKPISAFRPVLGPGKIEIGEGQKAGIEYSVDGSEWKPVVEFKTSASPQVLVENFVARDLNTTTLMIRFYARGGAKLFFWMSGSPSWGDAASTFVNRQIQIFVTPAAQ